MRNRRLLSLLILAVFFLAAAPTAARPVQEQATAITADEPVIEQGGDPSSNAWRLPFLRHSHTMIRDSDNDRFVIFGGWNGRSFFNDLWTLDPTPGSEAWSLIDIDGPVPPARAQHTAILDDDNHRMIVFGGRNRYRGFDDVWALDLTPGAEAWTELEPTGTPPDPRRWHSAIYDSDNQRMIVFGGGGGGDVFDDVWALDLTPGAEAWSELDLGISIPSARVQHSAIYDASNGRMVMFGGYTNGAFLNDVWTLDLTAGAEAWTQLGPAGTPPDVRRGHSAIYDHGGQMLVFGGLGSGGFYNDLWRMTLTPGAEEWSQLTPSGDLPGPRAWHTAAMTGTPYRMLVLGGRGMGETGGLQWDYSLGGVLWSPLTPSLPEWWQAGMVLTGGQPDLYYYGGPQMQFMIEDAQPDTVVNLMRGTEVWFVFKIRSQLSLYKDNVDVTLYVDTDVFDIVEVGTRHTDAEEVTDWTTPQYVGYGGYRLNDVDLVKRSGDTKYRTHVVFKGIVKDNAPEGSTDLTGQARGQNWATSLSYNETARIYRDPQAWIVTNRTLLFDYYADADVRDLLDEVFEQAQGGGYNGNATAVVLYADRYVSELRTWDNTNVNYNSETQANRVATALDEWLDSWHYAPYSVWPTYLVILGDDNIIPFYRKHDYNLICGSGPCAEGDSPNCWGEEAVCDDLVSSNYFMTDNPYGDIRGGVDWQEGSLEIAVGRIVGIDAADLQLFLENSTKEPAYNTTALLASGGDDHNDLWVPGYDNDAHDILKYDLGYNMNEGLIDTDPTKTEIVDEMEGGFTVMVAAGHGETYVWSAPGESGPDWPDDTLYSNEIPLYDPLGLIAIIRPFFFFQACRVGLSYTSGWGWPDYFNDTMVYSLAHEGASGVVASAGKSYGCFDPNCVSSGEVLVNEFWVDAAAYVDRSDPLGWALMQTKDRFVIDGDFARKTVQTFTYFGVPWMRLPGYGGPKSAATIPRTDATSTMWSAPTSFGLDATYAITTYVDASTYAISTTTEGWKLVEVDGLTQQNSSSQVVLPLASLDIVLPLSATVTHLAFTPTQAVTLPNLDMPTLLLGEPIPGGSGGQYTTTLDGVYPVTATFEPRPLETYQLVHVQVIPLTYDATNDQATLYQGVEVQVQYETTQTVALSYFDTDQAHYVPGDPITTTSRIVNAGAMTETITATLILQDARGHVVGFQGSGPLDVPAGGSYDLTLGWSGALEDDAYLARLLIWQAGQVVAGAGREVLATAGEITAVSAPEELWPGQPYTFTATFDNHTGNTTIAVVSLAIYDDEDAIVAFLTPQTVAVPGASSATLPFPWTPNRSGTYIASAVVVAGGQEYGPVSESFTVGYRIFLPLALSGVGGR